MLGVGHHYAMQDGRFSGNPSWEERKPRRDVTLLPKSKHPARTVALFCWAQSARPLRTLPTGQVLAPSGQLFWRGPDNLKHLSLFPPRVI